MKDKNTLIPLRQALEFNTEVYIAYIIREDVPVLCVNSGTKKERTMPFKALYENNSAFWLQEGSWEFYFSEIDFIKIGDTVNAKPAAWGVLTASRPASGAAKADRPSGENGMGGEYEHIAALTVEEQVQHINEDKKQLDSLIVAKPRNEEKIIGALVDTTRDSAQINHAALLQAMTLADDEAKKQTKDIVTSTCAMIKSSSRLITSNIFNDELMNTLVEKSNGTIIQHMTRVYLNGVAFLSYYNKLVSTSSIINKLRISFDKTYLPFYHNLLPHVHPDDLNLERVFYGGMRSVPEKQFFNWAVGFLVHDVGKATAVEYHEGEAAYNRDIVVEHVKIGYTSVMNKTDYPRDAGLITGYHHEYYGDSGGYGYFRDYLDQYKKANPSAKQDYCISFELEPMLDYSAMAYFPAKILEIIDVYDSITDPNRKYRKPLGPEEALAMMREEFINKHPKIDCILFDIFSGFVREKAQT